MYTKLGIKDRVPTNPGRVQLVPVSGQTNTYDMTLADNPTQTGTVINGAIFDTVDNALFMDYNLMPLSIQGCIAYPTINSAGQVTEIHHKIGTTVVRTDVYTYDASLVTEVRTIVATGDTITFKHHLDTLETEVI